VLHGITVIVIAANAVIVVAAVAFETDAGPIVFPVPPTHIPTAHQRVVIINCFEMQRPRFGYAGRTLVDFYFVGDVSLFLGDEDISAIKAIRVGVVAG